VTQFPHQCEINVRPAFEAQSAGPLHCSVHSLHGRQACGSLGFKSQALRLVSSYRLISTYSETNTSGRHRCARVLLNLWQANRTGFKGARCLDL